MTQPTDDIKELLKAWPDLAPNPQAMERTGQRMVSHIAVLSSIQGEDLSEQQFRLLAAVCAAIAITIYLAWPYIADLFTEYPLWRVIMACMAGISLLAPIILLLLPRGERTETVPYQPNGGTTIC
jgi:MFS family permease